ncbi:hypothetical protein ABT072_37325 [Streptomyces sp. NPDC002589]|uniref:hypothetical protein n=1 Tax=Streptomyces sp. NPDC002589 TaxID=3154420 RepID=UPI003321BDDE
MMRGRGAVVALSSLVLVGCSLVWAPAGRARAEGDEGVTCSGSRTTVYDPPLTLLPRPVHVHSDDQYTCTVAPGRTVAATGSVDSDSPGLSCLGGGGARTVETVRYADHRHSQIVYDDATVLHVAGVTLTRLSGRVVEGRGEGRAARRTALALPSRLPTDCLTSGLRSSSSGVQLEIQP